MTGAQLLRQYLEYAASPSEYFAARTSGGGEAESPFEEAVVGALTSRGYEVVPQVGVAGYRVDIGVRSQTGDGYVLGIECDGFSYHATPAARDRDWLRQSVLEDLGWKIYRVWSTAWIRNPSGELDEIERAIKAAQSESEESAEWSHVFQGSRFSPNAELLEKKPIIAGPDIEVRRVGFLFDEYELADLSDIPLDQTIDLAAAGTYLLRPFVTRVVEAEGPIHFEHICERIRQRWGLKRAGSAIRDRIKTAVATVVRDGTIEWDPAKSTRKVVDRFLVRPDVAPSPRRPRAGEPPRKIEHVSDVEIAAGVLIVVDTIHGGRRNDVIQQTAREFGYKRTGGQIDDRIGQVIHQMLKEGLFRQVNGVITAD